MSTSYFVSAHEDMRDAYEIVSASGVEHAADMATQAGVIVPRERDIVYVKCPRGTLSEVEVECAPMAVVAINIDDSERLLL